MERDIALARATRGHVHVAHLSTREALEAVRRAKKAGLRVTAEVTPHHFTLVDENVGDFNTHYKMNPPLRSAADRDALIQGILDGTIDAIATDHAPHAFHEKQVEFERAAFGITGLETALPIAITVLHQHFKLPLSRIVELLSSNPAKIFSLQGPGHSREGCPRRRHHLRSEEEVDLRCLAVALEIEEHARLTAGASAEKLWRRLSVGRSFTKDDSAPGCVEDEISSAPLTPNAKPNANRTPSQFPCRPANSLPASSRLIAAAAISRRKAIVRDVRNNSPIAAPR